jgi:hypothetical protein
MNKSLFRSQINFFDLDRNHNRSITLALLCAKHENVYIHTLFFNLTILYRYSNICDIRTTIVWKRVPTFGTVLLDHNIMIDQPIIILRPHGLFNAFNYTTTMHCITIKNHALINLSQDHSSVHWKKKWKSIEGHRMEIAWTFIGNRMDFGYP